MYERIYLRLRSRLDPAGRVRILRSSQDPEIARYLDWCEAMGSTMMDDQGAIDVKIHDRAGASKGTWLEELAHARQFLVAGNVPLTCDHVERDERELEVAQCLLDRAHRLRLSMEDRSHYERAIRSYDG